MAILGAIYLACAALPASAHTVLVASTPAADSVIDALPAELIITFAEDLVEIGNSNLISVTDPSGKEISEGEISVLGPTLTKDLIQNETTGIFNVTYRAVAADGHVIKGGFTFSVETMAVTTSEIEIEPITESPSQPENKLSIYLILSATAIVGGSLILIFIWKKQGK
ncbi:MAG: hypothetical protein RJA40_280 [Actinomycetota bacterium]